MTTLKIRFLNRLSSTPARFLSRSVDGCRHGGDFAPDFQTQHGRYRIGRFVGQMYRHALWGLLELQRLMPRVGEQVGFGGLAFHAGQLNLSRRPFEDVDVNSPRFGRATPVPRGNKSRTPTAIL